MKKVKEADVVKALNTLKKDENDLEALQTLFDFAVQIGALKFYSMRIPVK